MHSRNNVLLVYDFEETKLYSYKINFFNHKINFQSLRSWSYDYCFESFSKLLKFLVNFCLETILPFATFVGLKNRKGIFGTKVRMMPSTYQKGFQIGKKPLNVL